MKKLLFIFVSLFVGSANATLLDFEDVPGATQDHNGTHGNLTMYKGYNFENLRWYGQETPVNPPSNYEPYDGSYFMRGTEDKDTIGTIKEKDGKAFTFEGLFAKRWAAGPSSNVLDVTFSGYLDNNLVWSVTEGLGGAYEEIMAQAGNIDELRFASGTPLTYFNVDNIELNAVPIPAAVWLFGTGLIGLIGARKRQAL